MGDPYVLMLVALAALAIVDLVVGVSNDAVNFLNSAIGSKAISVRNIMIIASVGVFFGAISSSGMMEVARKGIFNPSMFVFQDVMFIFMAVMITDILLLDLFNSLGMPTSTTVSIVFELLGSAVVIAFIKISQNDAEGIASIWKYINYDTATDIILGILLSVVVAFSVGAIVQYFSRLIYSFNFANRPTYINSLFGGFAITAITYFIIIKGLKGTDFYENIAHVMEGNTISIIAISFILWTVLSYLLTKIFKLNILILIIGIGTFSLAMAFAGNDLVNFIGVPIAALNSYETWSVSGLPAETFSMASLAAKVKSNVWLLLIAGLVMVITLWTSSKAKSVIETGINLSR
ncbi:MAG: inorganic phosphate transporter, partial [Polaribacter sp.]